MKLEEEFEQYKALHKYATLKAMIIQYYQDLEDGKIKLPDFMRNDTPEKLADKDIKNLLCLSDGGEKFNRLYEAAWQVIAEIMP